MHGNRERTIGWLRRWALCGACWLAACGGGDDKRAPDSGSLTVAEALGGSDADAAGFARATVVPALQFPQDHAAHPAFRTEWWYVTGNLADAQGARFGVQLVFFRQALAPRDPAAPPRPSELAATEMVLAHAAITDVGGRRFFAEERLARAAAGLGTVSTECGPEAPFRVACADWTAAAATGGDGFLPLALHAQGDAFAFDLRVEPGKPLVLQGDRGLSQKSDQPGNASIYYSLTRLPIAGAIVVAGVRHDVRGEAWIDREWSTSALGADQVGWDWFSLQLDDRSEVMWYQLRRRDGSIDAWSRGCVVAADGTVTRLQPQQVTATPDGAWTASDGAARYPARWRLQGTGADAFDLAVEPLLPDQELRVAVRYWEGAVGVRGTRSGRAVAGHGYLEMTGYVRAR